MEIFILLLLVWIILAVAIPFMAASRGFDGASIVLWAMFSFLLAPVALLVVLAIPKKEAETENAVQSSLPNNVRMSPLSQSEQAPKQTPRKPTSTAKIITVGVGVVISMIILLNLMTPETPITRKAMMMQRVLIAQHLGWETRAISSIGHAENYVRDVGNNTFHIRNWYETPISVSRINYKMITRYNPARDTWVVVCFSTDVDLNGRECF